MLEIYTDGAYSSSRDQGGWSFVILNNNKIICQNCGGVQNTTNNRMEILAVLKALKFLQHFKYDSAILYSDSMYLIGTLIKNWNKNKNFDLWEEFDKYDLTKIKFKHVKGHSINEYNNLCDELAVMGSKLKII